jgi:hypothetical protein
MATSSFPLKAPFTRSSTATIWSSAATGRATARAVRRYRAQPAACHPLGQRHALRKSNALFDLSKLVAQARQAETGFHMTEWLTSLDFAHRVVRARLWAHEK